MNITLTDPAKIKQVRWAIIALSIAVPVIVAVLFGIKIEGVDLRFLPPIYATLNGLTAVLLVCAYISIRKKNKTLHRSFIRLALLCSLFFLAGYVAYHMTSDPTIYGDSNKDGLLEMNELDAIKGSATYYYALLISHVLLSIFVIPVVLFTYFYAWTGDFIKHRKWTKIAFPMWLYVAITGVVVYLMISAYY